MRERCGTHFLHDAGAVDFYRSLADAETSGHHFVGFSLGHEVEHFAFSWRQGIESLPNNFMFSEFIAALGVGCQRPLNPVDKLLIAKWFL